MICYQQIKLGQDLDFKQMLVHVSYLLLIGHAKITFVSSTEFNVSCIDCTLSNCVRVLKPGMSVMVVYQSAFVLLPVLQDLGIWKKARKYRKK